MIIKLLPGDLKSISSSAVDSHFFITHAIKKKKKINFLHEISTSRNTRKVVILHFLFVKYSNIKFKQTLD